MTKCGNFLCLLVQLRLKITKLTPIFVRLNGNGGTWMKSPNTAFLKHNIDYISSGHVKHLQLKTGTVYLKNLVY